MRILLTTHAFLPRSVAGVEVYTARLAGALQAEGHTVRIVTAVHDLAAEPYSVREANPGGLDVLEIVNPHLSGGLEATYRVAAIDTALDLILRDFRPDCVHAQHLLNLSTGLLDAARRAGVGVLLTLHDYWLSCPRDGLRMRADGTLCASVDHQVCARCMADSPYLVPAAQGAASRAARLLGLGSALHGLHRRSPRASAALLRLLRQISPSPAHGLREALDDRAAHLRQRVHELDSILAPTRFAAARALEWGAPADKLRVVPLGVIVGERLSRPAGPRRRLGYVGTLAPHKGAHVLIEAVRGLTTADWTLDLFGNGQFDAAYTDRLRSLAGGDARIRFRGLVSPEQQQRTWSSLDLLVLPSLWWENSPLTVLEALAAGVPVVASRTGGVPELLTEGAGALVEPGDAAALRRTLADVLDGRLLAEPLAALPLKTAQEGARELGTIYAEIAASRARRRRAGGPA